MDDSSGYGRDLTSASSSAWDFSDSSENVIQKWIDQGADIEAVRATLHFMEAHPDLDYGMPGPLVHFVERFYRKGYEAELTASLARRPTSHTAWMMNRVINGTSLAADKDGYLAALTQAAHHPAIDDQVRSDIAGFIALHRS